MFEYIHRLRYKEYTIYVCICIELNILATITNFYQTAYQPEQIYLTTALTVLSPDHSIVAPVGAVGGVAEHSTTITRHIRDKKHYVL